MSRFIRRAGVIGVASAFVLGAAAQAAPTTAAAPMQPLQVKTAHGVQKFEVEIASDEPARERGLMFRQELKPDRGMLFEFEDVAPRAFWMRNTYIPLDIIFIGADGKILNIAAQARPLDETPLPSHGPAKGVLEIQGGLAARLGIKPGDQVKHPFFQSR